MKRKIPLFVLTILFATLLFTNVVSAETAPQLKALIYEVDGEYVEISPVQYFTLSGSSNSDFRKVVYNENGTKKPPLALVDTREYVFSINMYFAAGSFSKLAEGQQVTEEHLLNHGSIEISGNGVVIVPGGPQEPSVTTSFTPDALLGEGFSLGKITTNVKGVTGATKYAVRYSVSNDTETKYVTTAIVNNGQATTDQVQYKAGKTIIDILVYNASGSEIHVFEKITIK